MKSLVAILCVGWVIASAAAQQRGQPGAGEKASVARFAVYGLPAVQALVELSKAAKAPLGIVLDDNRLCRSEVSYSGTDVQVASAVDSIVAQVPGYRWSRARDAPILLIAPATPRPVTARFLGLVDDRFGPGKGNLQMLLAGLEGHIISILYRKGVAASVLASTYEPVFEVPLMRNATVEQIINQIAVVSKGTWVLRPLPRNLDDLAGDWNSPFAFYTDFKRLGPGVNDVCLPIVGKPRQ